MRFVHYTDKPFKLEARKYLQQEPRSSFDKPNGFLVTPSEGEDTWADFCKAEQFNLEGLKIKYDVEIDLTKVLVIDSLKKFDEFESSYGKQKCDIIGTSKIDWLSIYKEFSGILIAPYFWSRRYRNWYYGCSKI